MPLLEKLRYTNFQFDNPNFVYWLWTIKKMKYIKYYHTFNPNFVYWFWTIKKIEKSSINHIL